MKKGSILLLVLLLPLAFAATPFDSSLGYHSLQQVTTDDTGTTSVDANSDGVIDRAASVGTLDGDASLGDGTTSATLKVKGSTTLWSAIDFYSGSSINMWGMGRNSAGNFYIDRSGAGNVITILQAAPYNVGIGTASPTQKLDVAGNVKGTGLCIGNDCRTAWPSSYVTGHCTVSTECNDSNYLFNIVSQTISVACGADNTVVNSYECYRGHCRRFVTNYVGDCTPYVPDIPFSGGTMSFIAGTKVTLADGTVKPIEEVKIGEILLGKGGSSNEVLGFLHHPKFKSQIYGFNGQKPFATEDHPFLTTEGWKSINPSLTKLSSPNLKVGRLKIGDTIVREDGLMKITSITIGEIEDHTMVHNFMMGGDYTYTANGYVVIDYYDHLSS